MSKVQAAMMVPTAARAMHQKPQSDEAMTVRVVALLSELSPCGDGVAGRAGGHVRVHVRASSCELVLPTGGPVAGRDGGGGGCGEPGLV